jgi:hypothetical protein
MAMVWKRLLDHGRAGGVVSRSGRVANRSDEAIAAARECLDEARVVCRVPEGLPDLVDRGP